MDDRDIFVFDADSAAQSSDCVIDLSGIDSTVTLDMSNYGAAQPAYTINTVDTITIDGTNWDGITGWLEDREILDQHRADQRIRETHPAVQHAWEQYQIMLNLAREELDDDPNEDLQ
jgi:hypothetical protein